MPFFHLFLAIYVRKYKKQRNKFVSFAKKTMPIIENFVDYIQQQINFIHKEKEAQIQQFGAVLSSDKLKEMKQAGVFISGLRIVHTYYGLGDYPLLDFQFLYPVNTIQFKPGSSIELVSSDGISCSAKLIDISEKRCTIKLVQEDFPDWIDEKGLGIKLCPDYRTLSLMEKEMANLLTKEGKTNNLILPFFTTNRLITIEKESRYLNQQLNKSQINAVESMLNLNGILIVHGPPGTGKTTVIAQAAKALSGQGKKLIATAPSNAAVDHLTRKLVQSGLKVLRLGNNTKIETDILPFTNEGMLINSTYAKQIKKLRIQLNEYRKLAQQYKRNFGKEEREQRNLLYKEARTIKKEIQKLQAFANTKFIEEADVICGTPIALCDDLPENHVTDTLIIDEASQLQQALAWCVMKFAKNMVIVGDPFQLPPTNIGEHGTNAAARSFLEAFHEAGFPKVFLEIQYRMDGQIAAFSSRYFYQNKLQSALPCTSNALYFFDTAGSDTQEEIDASGSKLNSVEADFIVHYLQKHNSMASSWTLLSPYQGQLNLFRGQEALNDYRKASIDSFQGQEDEGIILSMVRSNTSQKIGFLKDYRRINVALTRAKKKLIIFADSSTIGQDPFYQQLLDFIEKNANYKSVFELIYEGNE
jgi:superfamily I DNA and/or RNA helicase